MVNRLPLLLFAIVLFLAGCAGGPRKISSAEEGVTVFEDRNYGGRSLTLDRDQADLEDIQGPCGKTESSGPNMSTTTYTWGDCISSIRVSAGWSATVYGDNDYKGSSLVVTGDIPALRNVSGKCSDGMDDCISSIRVSRQ